MKIRELIDTARIPGGDELRLYRRGDDFIIAIGGNELMNSRMSGSEEALATIACERLAGRKAPHLLIGGYGMGFTLRAALAALGPDAKIIVAELVPEIIDWARGPMAGLAAGCLDDPRVDLVIGDVAAEIAAGRGRYDAILLDVDMAPTDWCAQRTTAFIRRRGSRRPRRHCGRAASSPPGRRRPTRASRAGWRRRAFASRKSPSARPCPPLARGT